MEKRLQDVQKTVPVYAKLARQLISAKAHKSITCSDDILNNLLHQARKSLGMEVAFISEFYGGRRVFRYVDSEQDYRPFEVDNSDPINESYCVRVVDGSLPELILNTQDNPITAQLAATKIYGIGNYIGVPIILSDNTLYGTCCCFSRQPDYSINQRDVEHIRFLAHCAALVIEKNVCGLRNFAKQRGHIKDIIKQRMFDSVFQPIFDLHNQHVVGFEALSRFTHLVNRTPQDWFKQAENSGLMQELELATLTAAMKQLPDNSDKYITVNLSPDVLLHKQHTVLASLPKNHRVVVEITEHDIIEDYSLVNKALLPLRNQGIKLAIDDVGAGFACLKHILLLKPDIIKIDQSIVRSIDGNTDAQALARAMVTLAYEIKCTVIAEGIETEAELATLRQLNINQGQGFLLAKPDKMALKTWH